MSPDTLVVEGSELSPHAAAYSELPFQNKEFFLDVNETQSL